MKGSSNPKCPLDGCKSLGQFENTSDLRSHLAVSHKMSTDEIYKLVPTREHMTAQGPLNPKCPVSGCRSSAKLESSGVVRIHLAGVYKMQQNEIDELIGADKNIEIKPTCPVKDCRSSGEFSRPRDFRQHLIQYHKMEQHDVDELVSLRTEADNAKAKKVGEDLNVIAEMCRMPDCSDRTMWTDAAAFREHLDQCSRFDRPRADRGYCGECVWTSIQESKTRCLAALYRRRLIDYICNLTVSQSILAEHVQISIIRELK
jgi:hypothetical protein